MKCPGEISLCAIGVILLAVIFVTGCTDLQQRPQGFPSSGKYAFLEHQIYYSGTLASGSCPVPAISVSPYVFDAGKETLAGILSFDVNSSLILVYGENITLSGGYGTGGYGKLSGAYALPYTNGNLTVNGFTPDGTMYLTYNNKTISLAPGTQWMDISTGTEKTRACTVNRTVTDSITYYGNYPQSGIARVKLV